MENLVDISLADFSHIVQTQQLAYCENLLKETSLLQKIKEGHFDLFILDYIDSCGRIMIDFVDIPSILYSNFGFSVESELFSPMPLAYTPMPLTPYSDHMSYLQRVRNVVEYSLTMFLYRFSFLPAFQSLRSKYNLNATLSVEDAYTRAQLVMVNTEFSLDYPRPIMPNIVTIGGLFYEAPQPLQRRLQDFVDGAPSGVFVVSFGSVIDRLEKSRAELLARAFASMPQYRFVWRLKGHPPNGLQNNTLLMDWIPQNDLLGHPATIGFISHCGISGTHEAVNHGVPVVALPMIIDQFYQAAKLVDHNNMGVKLNWKTLTQHRLTSAIDAVATNPVYKLNAIKLSRRMKDQPISARDKFLFWVDYLLRNGEAAHLNSDIVHKLSWCEYFLLDVFVLLASLILAVILATGFFLRYFLFAFSLSALQIRMKLKVL